MLDKDELRKVKTKKLEDMRNTLLVELVDVEIKLKNIFFKKIIRLQSLITLLKNEKNSFDE